MRKLPKSQYRLRKIIGILGIALPILLLLNHEDLLSSMSHYYYTSASVFFIGILVAFGLVLYTYEGHKPKSDKSEFLSDNATTTLAAIFIFITVLVPTRWEGAMGKIYFIDNLHYLFGHNHIIKGTIHLVSAGLFLVLLGYMSFTKFRMGDDKRRKKLYKTCGIIIWSSVAMLIVLFAVDRFIMNDQLNCYFPAYTFWFEMLAVWAFGIAWLVKGRFDIDAMELPKKLKKKNSKLE